METSSRDTRPAFREIDIAVGAQRVNALALGSGPAIILFHSLLADRSSFDLIAGPLAQTHEVFILNLPGFGSSDPAGAGLEAVADRVAVAILKLELRSPPVFLGNGYGGFIALMAAIRHPGIASRLVLAGCGAAFSEPGRAAFRHMSATAREKGLAAVADVAMRRLFSAEFQAAHPGLIAERKRHFLAVDPQVFYNACDGLASLDLRPRLASLDVPVMILVGEGDEATPPPMARELAAGLPNATLHELPGCAHVPQLQEPQLFLAAIGEFIGAA